MSKFYLIIAQKINNIFQNFIGRGTWGAHHILRLWLHGQLAQHASSLFVAQRPSTYSPGNRKKLGVAPLEFRHEPDICKQTRFWLYVSEEIFVPFNTRSEHDGQTDGQTDKQTDGYLCYSNTSTCIACYDTATALVKKIMLSYMIANISGTAEDIQNRPALQTMAVSPAFNEKGPVNFG